MPEICRFIYKETMNPGRYLGKRGIAKYFPDFLIKKFFGE
jgi:hypothetical protein